MWNKMFVTAVAMLCALLLVIYLAVYPLGEATASRQVMTAENGETMRNSTLAVANNEFGFDLFQQLKRQAANKNIFFSPLSVTMALAMAYNGAEGETKRAMARALRIQGPEDQGMDLAELNRESGDLLRTLKSADPKIELAIANSIWARRGMRFNEDFLARNRQFYGAEISTLNFSDPKSNETINKWVR